MFSNLKILIVNDDGYLSSGIKILTKKLIKYAKEILVVAPKNQMSATSQKLTLKEGIKIEKENDIVEGISTYSVCGTPADCVKIAFELLSFKPDIVFSGVNDGYNLGYDILYSGTIGAATEASFAKVKTIALSCDFGTLEGMKYFDDIMSYLEESDIYKEAQIININIPQEAKGIKITKQGGYIFNTKYEIGQDGMYHLKGIMNDHKNIDQSTDFYATLSNYISITPLTYDRTDIKLYEKLIK